MSNETTITRMMEAYNERRFDDFCAGYTDDATIDYPQSGERIAGRDNILGMLQAFPSPPEFRVNTMRSAGELVVAEVDADYGGGSIFKGVLIYVMEDGRVGHESAYFAGPFEAADWRAPFRVS